MDKTSSTNSVTPKKGDKSSPSFPVEKTSPHSLKKNQRTVRLWTTFWLILCLICASFFYNLIVNQKLEQTSLMFIGLPAILALLISFIPTKTTTGLMAKGTCLFLMISGVFFGEGMICILMATPIFLTIAVFVGVGIDLAKRKNAGRTAVFLFILPFTFEGTHPNLSFPRHEEVTIHKRISIQEAPEKILSRRLTFSKKLPFFLTMGFPTPLYVTGGDLKVGSQGCFQFSAGKKPGDICFRITRKEDNKMIFGDLQDNSPFAHWLKGKEGIIQWKTNKDLGVTDITLTLIYDRLLDPAWYFGPFERYAVKLAGEYLLSSYFDTKKPLKPPSKENL